MRHVLLLSLAGCLPQIPVAAPPGNAGAPGVAGVPVSGDELRAQALAALGGATSGDAAVAGAAFGTVHPVDVRPGACLEVAVAADLGTMVSIVPRSETTRWYGHDDGDTGVGRPVVHTVCVDTAGPVHLALTAALPPGQSPLATVHFHLAWGTRPESAEQATARRAADRERLLARGHAECDAIMSPAAFQGCRERLAADVARRDAAAAAGR